MPNIKPLNPHDKRGGAETSCSFGLEVEVFGQVSRYLWKQVNRELRDHLNGKTRTLQNVRAAMIAAETVDSYRKAARKLHRRELTEGGR